MNKRVVLKGNYKILLVAMVGIFLLFSVGAVNVAYGLTKEPHGFSDSECILCHLDIGKDAGSLKPISSSICLSCHKDMLQILSHPMDIFPDISVPEDMPLLDGKMSCITCHVAHPFSITYQSAGYSLLRRSGKGATFCSVCHRMDEKGHTVFGNVHMGSYQETDLRRMVDEYSLQCIECHDKQFDNLAIALGAGRWEHFSSQFCHPVGVSYSDSASKHRRKFNPAFLLPKEIRLFNGKIGCGTCHNVYSKEKFMLATSNTRSSLCLQCHIK